jgi:hypothetical protein
MALSGPFQVSSPRRFAWRISHRTALAKRSRFVEGLTLTAGLMVQTFRIFNCFDFFTFLSLFRC